MEIIYKSIGIIYTPFTSRKEIPKNTNERHGIKGKIQIYEKFVPGLKDLEGFSHIYIIYHLHLVKNYSLEATPIRDNKTHGVFATRSPDRPNPIGITIVKLDKVIDNILYIDGMDCLNETPLLDIKPYSPLILEKNEELKLGWTETL